MYVQTYRLNVLKVISYGGVSRVVVKYAHYEQHLLKYIGCKSTCNSNCISFTHLLGHYVLNFHLWLLNVEVEIYQ